MPPKNADEAGHSASDEAPEPKKTPRRRSTSRLTRSKSAPRRSAEPAEAAPGAEAPSTPVAAEAPPPPPPAPPREPEPPREQPAAPVQMDLPAPTVAAPAAPESASPQPAVEPSFQAGADQRPEASQGGGQGQPNQGGDWQERGGRDFWKRNKRKRGRHGGHWQPGGPGGQGGPREQHPPQPPPPSNTPVFGELPNPSRFNDLAALETSAQDIASGGGEPIFLNELYARNLADLTAYARNLGGAFEGVPNRKQLLTHVMATAAERKRPLRDRGYIDVTDRGAFIVHEHVNYRLYPEDPYLPESLIKLYGLKRGHRVEVQVQAPLPGERCPSVVRVESVMGLPPNDISKITPFEELVPYYPLQRILLESAEPQKDVSMRAVDILTPIGFGQRALIVAPPRTGKTILLQNIANSVTENSPHAKLILLLIDERPEEVTDFRRHTKGEVVSSTFDETPESHVHCAEMVIENARRRVEMGEHVVILLDSITRLARAYNALAGNQGKTMSGGLESNALQKPKRFFGSARNIEGGGSLTIIASALIDTGSRMDEIIFEEFKGTGNCELHLDRGLVERRIFPAINIDRSGTRKEELIYHPEELQRIYGLRRAMQGLGPIESMEMLITRLKKTKSNAEFLLGLSRT
jgi:transcription termination factor Rho